jgi:hypothetical protein
MRDSDGAVQFPFSIFSISLWHLLIELLTLLLLARVYFDLNTLLLKPGGTSSPPPPQDMEFPIYCCHSGDLDLRLSFC